MDESKTHHLKTHPEPFRAVWDRHKSFEWRKNDRGFGLGDTLILQEYSPLENQYTGRFINAIVTYILYGGQLGIPADYCIMEIVVLSRSWA